MNPGSVGGDQRLRDLDSLRIPGEKNQYLEGYIEDTLENREETHLPLDNNSPLEIVNEDLSISENAEEEEVFYLDERGFVCSAEPGPGDEEKGWENGLKGHGVRNIGVYRQQGVIPPPKNLESSFGQFNIAEVLRNITAEQVDDGYVVLYGSMSSVENHFHLMASDLEVESGAESDLEDVASYFLYSVDDSETEFLEGRVSGSFGEYIQEMLDEDEEIIDFRNS